MTKQVLKGIRVQTKDELVSRIYKYFEEINAELTLNDNDKSKDIVKTLRNSLTEEDNLPKPYIDYFHIKTITGK